MSAAQGRNQARQGGVGGGRLLGARPNIAPPMLPHSGSSRDVILWQPENPQFWKNGGTTKNITCSDVTNKFFLVFTNAEVLKLAKI